MSLQEKTMLSLSIKHLIKVKMNLILIHLKQIDSNLLDLILTPPNMSKLLLKGIKKEMDIIT